MRIKGTLSKWNDDRGFGFISPIQDGQDIFVHISAFPKDGIRPTLGETLIFEIETDTRGKKRSERETSLPTTANGQQLAINLPREDQHPITAKRNTVFSDESFH